MSEVEVTQADRDLASDILDAVSSCGTGHTADCIRDGRSDDHECVRIARDYRQQTTADLRERLAEALADGEKAAECWDAAMKRLAEVEGVLGECRKWIAREHYNSIGAKGLNAKIDALLGEPK